MQVTPTTTPRKIHPPCIYRERMEKHANKMKKNILARGFSRYIVERQRAFGHPMENAEKHLNDYLEVADLDSFTITSAQQSDGVDEIDAESHFEEYAVWEAPIGVARWWPYAPLDDTGACSYKHENCPRLCKHIWGDEEIKAWVAFIFDPVEPVVWRSPIHPFPHLDQPLTEGHMGNVWPVVNFDMIPHINYPMIYKFHQKYAYNFLMIHLYPLHPDASPTWGWHQQRQFFRDFFNHDDLSEPDETGIHVSRIKMNNFNLYPKGTTKEPETKRLCRKHRFNQTLWDLIIQHGIMAYYTRDGYWENEEPLSKYIPYSMIVRYTSTSVFNYCIAPWINPWHLVAWSLLVEWNFWHHPHIWKFHRTPWVGNINCYKQFTRSPRHFKLFAVDDQVKDMEKK